MAWLRLSLGTPLPGSREEVLRLYSELEDTLATDRGFILGGVIATDDGEVGRFALWDTRENADRASGAEHVIAVRSQIHNLVEPGHIEHLFQIMESAHNIPGG